MKSMNNQAFRAQLTTLGRKTRKEHTVWLLAVMYNDKIYFSRHRPDGDWFKNAMENPKVKVNFEGSIFSGNASLVSDELLAQKISKLKYPNQKRSNEKRVALEIKLN
jgi:hypothetical protein